MTINYVENVTQVESTDRPVYSFTISGKQTLIAWSEEMESIVGLPLSTIEAQEGEIEILSNRVKEREDKIRTLQEELHAVTAELTKYKDFNQ